MFVCLAENWIIKLFKLIKENNLELRILSIRLLIEILYDNSLMQNNFCKKFNFSAVGNIICLNWLPKNFKGIIEIDDVFLGDIKLCYNQRNKNNKTFEYIYNKTNRINN